MPGTCILREDLLVFTAWVLGKVGFRRGALGRGARVPKALEHTRAAFLGVTLV